MKKIIEIDLLSEEAIFEKYNKKLANKELIQHIIYEADPFDKKENIMIKFNNKTKIKKEEYMPIIKESLQNEYNKCIKEINHNNINQFIYLIIGIILLFISTIFNFSFIFGQIFLIGGWVLIWKTIEIQVFADIDLKNKKNVLVKLLNSELREID